MRGLERRSTPRALELRRGESSDEMPRIVGYAAVFNKPSVDFGGWRERIARGAFASSLSRDVKAFWDHDPGQVLGRTGNRTLSLREDLVGLRVTIDPPRTTLGRDAVKLIERGDVVHMSFAFRTLTDEWNRENGDVVRTLVDVDLIEVSPVSLPAYPDTRVDVVQEAARGVEPWEEDLDLLRRRLDSRVAMLRGDNMLTHPAHEIAAGRRATPADEIRDCLDRLRRTGQPFTRTRATALDGFRVFEGTAGRARTHVDDDDNRRRRLRLRERELAL